MSARAIRERSGPTVRRLIKRTDSAGVDGTVATLDNYPLVFAVTGSIKLVQILPGTLPHLYLNKAESIFCLGVDEGQFTLDEAISWLRSAFADISLKGEERLPFVVVLGNPTTLSGQDLDKISLQISRLGAYFVRWPEGCASFEEAFHALRNEIAENYESRDLNKVGHWEKG